MAKVLLRVSATLEGEEWVEIDDTLTGREFARSVEDIGNDMILSIFNGGDGDYDYEIMDIEYPNPDEDDEDYDEDEDEDYVPSDPDSVGTFINSVG